MEELIVNSRVVIKKNVTNHGHRINDVTTIISRSTCDIYVTQEGWSITRSEFEPINPPSIEVVLNDALNKALVGKNRIKNPNSNKIAEFVIKYLNNEQ